MERCIIESARAFGIDPETLEPIAGGNTGVSIYKGHHGDGSTKVLKCFRPLNGDPEIPEWRNWSSDRDRWRTALSCGVRLRQGYRNKSQRARICLRYRRPGCRWPYLRAHGTSSRYHAPRSHRVSTLVGGADAGHRYRRRRQRQVVLFPRLDRDERSQRLFGFFAIDLASSISTPEFKKLELSRISTHPGFPVCTHCRTSNVSGSISSI